MRADMDFKGGSLRLTDTDILDAPLVFMTGHDKDITMEGNREKGDPLTDGFSAAKRANLRKYIIDRGRVLFFDDCGFNGLFAQQVKAELDKIFRSIRSRTYRTTTRFTNSITNSPCLPEGATCFGVLRAQPSAGEASTEPSRQSSRIRKESRLAAD